MGACRQAAAPQTCRSVFRRVASVEADTAEVIVACEAPPCGEGWQSISSFEFAVGRILGWSWIGINSQGYKDSVTIAFGPGPDGIDPRCTFITDGGCGLYCYDLVQRRA